MGHYFLETQYYSCSISFLISELLRRGVKYLSTYNKHIKIDIDIDIHARNHKVLFFSPIFCWSEREHEADVRSQEDAISVPTQYGETSSAEILVFINSAKS